MKYDISATDKNKIVVEAVHACEAYAAAKFDVGSNSFKSIDEYEKAMAKYHDLNDRLMATVVNAIANAKKKETR